MQKYRRYRCHVAVRHVVAYSPPVIGEIIDGKYRVVGLIGEGGMGAVYEAQHTTTGRNVAIKVISDNAMMADEVLRARFQREAQAASKVRSAHIVEILDAGLDPATNHPYMVMDLLHGENVLDTLKRLECLSPDLVIRIGYQTCLGLAKAHDVGVVHRDIKPANLFLSDGEANELDVKLLDFGVAKFKMDQATETSNEALTRTGSMLGSPMYMSPEQARGLKTIDHRADIWSLGVVLYQLLAGHTPYHSIDGLGELIITICSEEPDPLVSKAPWVSEALGQAVQKALKLSPEDRYQSAHEFGEALLALLPDGRWRIQRNMMVAADKGAEDLADTVSLATAGAPPETAPPNAAAIASSKPAYTGGDSTVALSPDQMPELSAASPASELTSTVDGEAETERLQAGDVASAVASLQAGAAEKKDLDGTEDAKSARVESEQPEEEATEREAGGLPPMLVAVLLLALLAALGGYFLLPGAGSKGSGSKAPGSTAASQGTATTSAPKPVATAAAGATNSATPPTANSVAPAAASGATAAPSSAGTPSASARPSAPARPAVVPRPWPKSKSAPKEAFVPGSP